MKRIFTPLLTLLIIGLTQYVCAEQKLAMLTPKHKTVLLRLAPGKGKPIITTIEAGQFFYCDFHAKDKWIKVSLLVWKDQKQVKGYLNRNDIQLIEKLSKPKQRSLYIKVLIQQKNKCLEFLKAINTSDSLLKISNRNIKEAYDETHYTPFVQILPNYFCKQGDTTLLNLFLSTIWIDKGSANEEPTIGIGRCYICKPDLVLNTIKLLKDPEQISFLLNAIEWGLRNEFGIEEDTKSMNQEYNHLKVKLDKAK